MDSVLQVVNDEDDDDEDDSLTGTSIFVRKEIYCAEREETSNHGEQDAVKKGSEDQAKEASENAGGEEQELSQGGSDDVHVKHQKPVPSRRAAPPSKESLFASVDALYLRADVAHMKVKEFMAAIEEKYGMPLEKPTRSLVKKRLMQLIAKKVLSPVNPKGLASTAAPTAQVSPRKAPNDDTKHDSESNHQIKSTSGRRSGKASKETCSRVDEQQGAATTKIATTRASPRTTGTTDKKSKSSAKAVRATSDLSKAPPRARDKDVPTPNATDTDKKKPRRSTKQRGTCALCSTCPCLRRSFSGEVATRSVDALSRSDAQVERTLIRRQKKLEKTVDKYEGDLDQVKRELQRHRRNILKKKAPLLAAGKKLAFGNSRFLPKVDEWETHNQNLRHRVIPQDEVRNAQRQLFGSNNVYQPTLTQMLGSTKSTEKQKDDLESDHEANSESQPQQISSPASHQQELGTEGRSDVSDNDGVSVDDERPDCHKVSWRNGKLLSPSSPSLGLNSLWEAALSRPSDNEKSTILCGFDRLFDEKLEGEEGVDQLVQLFENEASLNLNYDNPSGDENNAPQITLSMLSQGGQETANAIETEILQQPLKHRDIEAGCPSWRENVRFAILQEDPVNLQDALDSVQISKGRLISRKKELLAAFGRLEAVLGLYETSLSTSLDRRKKAAYEDKENQQPLPLEQSPREQLVGNESVAVH